MVLIFTVVLALIVIIVDLLRRQRCVDRNSSSGNKRVGYAIAYKHVRNSSGRVQRDAAFRKGLLSEALESLLSGEVTLGKELLRDYINATVGFPKLAAHTQIHVKTLHHMFGLNGNPTASNPFEIVAYLQHAEGVPFEVRSARAALRRKRRPSPRRVQRTTSGALSP